jgi:hypothetical protein
MPRRRGRLWGGEAQFAGRACRVPAAGDVQLVENVGDVVLDGLVGDEQAGCDLGVSQAVGDQLEDLEFARGEASGVGAGAASQAARNSLAEGA